jgi:hypothetical protein
MSTRTLALSLALLFAIPLLADSPATVTIGRQTKKTIGVLKSAESGDTACYLSLVDDRGVAFDEMADFEICEQTSLIGKRVLLKYEMANVMSDECQGDPDCTKTRSVPLVISAKVLPAATAKPVGPKTSFCASGESIVFSCGLGAKMVSVCASKDASPAHGSLQYRFGKAGSREPLEMTLPAKPTSPENSASGESVPFSGGGGSWLRFHNGPYGYVVYTGIGKWGPKGETREKEGVVVERAGKVVASLKCSTSLTSALGPDWFDALGIEANDEEFDFPD